MCSRAVDLLLRTFTGSEGGQARHGSYAGELGNEPEMDDVPSFLKDLIWTDV